MTPLPDPVASPIDPPVIFPRRTLFKLGVDQFVHCRVLIRPDAHDDERKRYDELSIRSIRNQIETAGFTTHLDVVRRTVEVHETPGNPDPFDPSRNQWGTGERTYIFPPTGHPRPGDHARVLGGPASGTEFKVPSKRPEFPTSAEEYILSLEPVAFDTATGHWLYSPTGYHPYV